MLVRVSSFSHCIVYIPTVDALSFGFYKAVGKTFLVSKPHQATEQRVMVSMRPTQCYLCPVKNEMHAMNILYDFWGRDGRPKLVRDSSGKETIAWVHTLCALVINSNPRTAGCVYGCDEYGRYENFDIVPDEDSYMDKDDGANVSVHTDSVVYIPHHFVQVNEDDPEHAYILKDIRKNNLKCDVCGISSQKGHYFPIQCIANDEYEFKDFQKKHKNTMECTAAFHVGCARWSSHEKRIIFHPESDKEDVIIGGYCCLHASNISGGGVTHKSKNLHRKSEESDDHIHRKKRLPIVDSDNNNICRQAESRRIAKTQSNDVSNIPQNTSLELKHPDVMLAFTSNPWSVLWYPTYVQGACNLEDWDTIEEISPPNNFQDGGDLQEKIHDVR
jgi:hypothetical protein